MPDAVSAPRAASQAASISRAVVTRCSFTPFGAASETGPEIKVVSAPARASASSHAAKRPGNRRCSSRAMSPSAAPPSIISSTARSMRPCSVKGVAIGTMGSAVGFETDLGYARNFFGDVEGQKSSVLTIMSNLMIIPKIGARKMKSAVLMTRKRSPSSAT